MPRWVIRTSADAVNPGEVSGGPDLPGSTGGTGMTWDLVADTLPPGFANADAVALRTTESRRIPLTGPRVKRTLLLTVRPGTPGTVMSQFESELIAMPERISSIRSWALSRADHTVPGASTRWTHIWEQEFADPEGLTGEYLRHPYHWTCVDRWFDSENPAAIAEPTIAHLFRWAADAVL
jgi:hypothetical protein